MNYLDLDRVRVRAASDVHARDGRVGVDDQRRARVEDAHEESRDRGRSRASDGHHVAVGWWATDDDVWLWRSEASLREFIHRSIGFDSIESNRIESPPGRAHVFARHAMDVNAQCEFANDINEFRAKAAELERRAHVISGRVAQVDSNLKSLSDELTSLNEMLKESERRMDDIRGCEDEDARTSLYNARRVIAGAGPGGDMYGYMKPAPVGRFLKFFVGGAVEINSARQEARLRLKEEYYQFRDRNTLVYVIAPLALLLGYTERAHPTTLGDVQVGYLRAFYPIALQLYWIWMLYFYTALALRENILRANGSTIRGWWIKHHYYSAGMALCVLTMDLDSPACAAFTWRFLLFTTLQGVVMLVQNRYQRLRMYTRVAMGKASPMDVSSNELSGGQLKLLYPLLFGLQAMQFYVGSSVLYVVFTTYRYEGHIMREWQASVAGGLFVGMAVGNFTATLATLRSKQTFKSKARTKSQEKLN